MKSKSNSAKMKQNRAEHVPGIRLHVRSKAEVFAHDHADGILRNRLPSHREWTIVDPDPVARGLCGPHPCAPSGVKMKPLP